ncbi:Rho termination factor N-terminal domain-containing protein [Streptomyces shaanxiensis]
MSDTTDLMGARVEDTAAAPATDAAPASGAGSRRRRGTGLEGMVLAELQQVASGLGIRGTARMRKSQLIEVIKEAQAGGGAPAKAETATETKPKRRATSKARTGEAAEKKAEAKAEAPAEKAVAQQQIEIPGQPAAERGSDDAPAERRRRRATAEAGAPAGSTETIVAEAKTEPKAETPAQAQQQPQADAGDGEGRGRRDRRDRGRDRGERGDRQDRGDRRKSDDQQGQGGQRQQQNQQQGGGRQDRQQRDNGPQDDDDFEGGRRGRRGRYRDRRGRRGRDEIGGAGEPQINEDDVLIPVAGILDILDNYAFIRTSGYLPGPNDVYVSLAQVRKNGLRKGDHITGAVRQPKEGERREKFNALVRLDSVNGMAPEHGRGRPEFNKLTPLYPQDRLRLETDPGVLTTRIIDLVSPIGKGQRGLIVAPPKTGNRDGFQDLVYRVPATGACTGCGSSRRPPAAPGPTRQNGRSPTGGPAPGSSPPATSPATTRPTCSPWTPRASCGSTRARATAASRPGSGSAAAWTPVQPAPRPRRLHRRRQGGRARPQQDHRRHLPVQGHRQVRHRRLRGPRQGAQQLERLQRLRRRR